MNTLKVIGCLLLLSACSIVEGKQQYAGINQMKITNCDGKSCEFVITEGTEKSGIDVAVKLPDGTEVNYIAEGVQAFEGQAFRAQVHSRLIEMGLDPDLVSKIINGLVLP